MNRPSSTAAPPLAAVNIFDPRRLFTVSEVIERTQFSRSVLYEEMREGRLSFIKRGESRRLLGVDLNAFVSRYYHSCNS